MTLTIQNKKKIKTKKQKDFIYQMDNYDSYVHDKDNNRQRGSHIVLDLDLTNKNTHFIPINLMGFLYNAYFT